jgi:hypothetical protein
MCQDFPLGGIPKCIKIWIFGSKINHLATLILFQLTAAFLSVGKVLGGLNARNASKPSLQILRGMPKNKANIRANLKTLFCFEYSINTVLYD